MDKAYRVVREDGSYPVAYEYREFPNIFFDRAEAERKLLAVKAYNLGKKLIIEETEVNWQPSVGKS